MPPAEAGAAVRDAGCARSGQHHGERGAGGGPTGRWAGARGRGGLGRGPFGSSAWAAGAPVGRLRAARGRGGLGALGRWRPRPGPGERRVPGGPEAPGHTLRGVPAPPPPCAAPGPCLVASQTGGRAPWLPAFFVPRARPSVGTGAAGGGRACAARPPAPRVAAGSGAGCRAGGGGGGAESPGGGRLGLAGARGRAPGRSPVSRVQGRRSSRPGKAAVAPTAQTRCARGPHPRRRGAWRGPKPSLGLSVFSQSCALAQRACALEEESSVFPCPGDLVFSGWIRLGALPLGTPGRASGPGGSGAPAPRPEVPTPLMRPCLAVCVPRRLALCSVHARVLRQGHRWTHG